MNLMLVLVHFATVSYVMHWLQQSGVSYASVTSKLTPDSVVTYLFHDQ